MTRLKLQRFLIVVSVSLFTITSCKKKSVNCGLDCGDQPEELLFQTGFSGSTLTNGSYDNAQFSGTDVDFTDNSDWESFNNHPNIGFVEIGYEDGNDTQRKATISPDPDDESNPVLKYTINEPHIKEGSNYKGRIQLSIHDNNCIKEIYQKVKLKLNPDLSYFEEREERLYWFTLFEFWNNGAWTKEKNPFRVSVNLNKEEGANQNIFFRVKADYQNCRICKWKEVWGETDHSFPLVYGEWIEIELYLKEGDNDNGRFYMAVTPKNGVKTILFDIQNTTQHPDEKCPDGFTHFEAMKMYTSDSNINYMKSGNKELSIYWDDWQLNLNKTPD